MPDTRLEIFNQHRALLFSIAYRMLGSVMDAEDMVQEAFLRWQQAGAYEVQSPKAYLTTIITRLCLNYLQLARVRREEYVGPWLPEPLVTEETGDPAGLSESLSMAFLVLLENLSPVERAVFLLREVFEYEYAEIARMVNKSEANCRQIFHRARQNLTERRPRFEPSPQQQERLTRQFIQVTANGDMEGLLALLADDIVLWSDGGGKVNASLKPIYGSQRVSRFVLGAMQKFVPPGQSPQLTEINGQIGIISYFEQHPQAVLIFDIAENLIQTIYIISNPEKLQSLPPV